MTKKPVFWLSLIAAAALAVAGVIWAKQYYDTRYALEDYYYTVVPFDYDFTPTVSYSAKGKAMDLKANYGLACYNAQGRERKLEFIVFLNFHDLYPPGTYVKVSASKVWATDKSAVPITDVPEKALEKIKENYAPSSASSLAGYAGERTRILKARAFPAAGASCALIETELVYTYIYGAGEKETALGNVEFLDPVYKSQFRADKEAFPELTAIRLIIKLEDGTEIFSKKYNEKVKFSYEIN